MQHADGNIRFRLFVAPSSTEENFACYFWKILLSYEQARSTSQLNARGGKERKTTSKENSPLDYRSNVLQTQQRVSLLVNRLTARLQRLHHSASAAFCFADTATRETYHTLPMQHFRSRWPCTEENGSFDHALD